MPEYLSPGVYVEEVSTGTRPIEGVSTSTTGLVGVTERGPEDVPVLVTSIGDFKRVYGDHLDFREFTDPSGRNHAYLPHAVDGFFPNGGRRAYVVRVLPDDALHSRRFLFDRAEAGDAGTVLLRSVPQGSGTGVNLPRLYALDPSGMAAGDWLRVGEGSRAEYRQIAIGGVPGVERHVSLNFPLGSSFNAATNVQTIAAAAPDAATYALGSGGVFVLAQAAEAGSTQIIVNAGPDLASFTPVPGGDAIFEIRPAGGDAEHCRAIAAAPVGGTNVRLTLSAPLNLSYATASTSVTALDIAGAAVTAGPLPLDLDATAGDLLAYCDPSTFTTNELIVFDPGTAMSEVRRIAQLSDIEFEVGAYRDYPYGTIMQLATVQDDDRSITGGGGTTFTLDDVRGLVAGQELYFDSDPTDTAIITAIDETLNQVDVNAAPASFADPVVPTPKQLTAAVAAGRIILSLDNRLGLVAGDVLRVGMAPDEEYVTIADITDPRGVGADPGTVLLTAPLRRAHVNGAEVRRQHPPIVDTTRQSIQLVLASDENSTRLFVNDGNNPSPPNDYDVGEFVQVRLPNGEIHHHQLASDSASLTPSEVELTAPVTLSHEAGLPLVERRPEIRVRALDRGAAGNRLQVSVEDELTGLVSGSELSSVAAPLELRLSTLTGAEAGTILELRNPNDGTVVGNPLKVRSVDRASNNLVVLDPPGLSPAQVGAHNAAILAGEPLAVASREFSISVWSLDRPHPAIPSRGNQLRDSEVFPHLSLDPRHSRYIHRVIGTTWTVGNPEDDDGTPLRAWDQRSEGESRYIRVRDLANTQAEAESVRLGPETLVDELPSGLERPARHPLAGGSDSVATMSDAMYQGSDDDEPLERTGLFTLNNIPDISLVAIPGQTTPAVQQALIDHCENDSYRFAILDAHGPNRDTLADVQNQRQQFDTSFAGLYHPWATIPEPMPQNLSNIRQVPIPPSGHVAGVYARTDNERGVHKAPANEVMRGITGLQRSLNKGEHDILNPFPRNINVIRDFREENRGIRIWGGRVITSDSDYKYVNVRRLMIFIRASLDRGLPWVVFEPNSEKTWARVRRSLTNFLTVVYRNGALEGSTAEEAFFVKCDRTTMTQQDLDNGRLIAVIGVAPVKPAEFVIVRIGLWTANAEQ